jgi:hypothetical protein
MTVRLASLPASSLVYDGFGFHIGEHWLGTTAPDNKAYDMRIHSESLNRQVLSTGNRSFTLAPEPGDETSFTIDRSCLSWPTPFETNFMTGHSPSWKRHLYYRLVWKKRSGAKLEMVWCYEQWFYSTDGWGSGAMLHENSTGLIRVHMANTTAPLSAPVSR